MTHKERLEQWWGESADSFPGPFSLWLMNRIKYDSDTLEEDWTVLEEEIKELEAYDGE